MSRCCLGLQSVWNPSVTYSHGCIFPICIILCFLCLFALVFLCSVIDSVSQDCLEFLTSWPCYHNTFFYRQQTSSTRCSFPFPCLAWLCQAAEGWAWVSAELHWWLLFAPRETIYSYSCPVSIFQLSISPQRTLPLTSLYLVSLRRPLVFGKGLGWSPFGNLDRSEWMGIPCPCLAPLKNSARVSLRTNRADSSPADYLSRWPNYLLLSLASVKLIISPVEVLGFAALYFPGSLLRL